MGRSPLSPAHMHTHARPYAIHAAFGIEIVVISTARLRGINARTVYGCTGRLVSASRLLYIDVAKPTTIRPTLYYLILLRRLAILYLR
eukprot:10168080-Lingulodinium_polyedra.AAC.1